MVVDRARLTRWLILALRRLAALLTSSRLTRLYRLLGYKGKGKVHDNDDETPMGRDGDHKPG